MRAVLFTSCVALIAVAIARATPAQQVDTARHGRQEGPRQSVSASGGAPRGTGRLTSRVELARPAIDPARPRVPFVGLPWTYLGFVPLLLWDGTACAALPQQGAGAGTTAPRGDLPRGGLQLDVFPRRAQVYVDGGYAGVVDDFRGYYRHLELPAGCHLIEIYERGYYPLTLTVVITPGRTLTYRNTLNYASRAD